MIQDVHHGSRILALDFFPIPDPGVIKEPDPGSESATLLETLFFGSWYP